MEIQMSKYKICVYCDHLIEDDCWECPFCEHNSVDLDKS